MCVGTTATLAIVGGIGAAGSVASAKIASNAAKDAAQTQAKAGQQALTTQQQMYQQARQDFNPYQQAGAGALGRLGQRASAAPPAFTPGQPSNFGTMGTGQNPALQPAGATNAPHGMGQPPTGQMVTLRAPDGTTQQFPADRVQQVMQLAQSKGHQLQVVQ